MASIYQRTNKDGSKIWRAGITSKNYLTVSDHFDGENEAEDWAKETEIKINKGKYSFVKNEYPLACDIAPAI